MLQSNQLLLDLNTAFVRSINTEVDYLYHPVYNTTYRLLYIDNTLNPVIIIGPEVADFDSFYDPEYDEEAKDLTIREALIRKFRLLDFETTEEWLLTVVAAWEDIRYEVINHLRQQTIPLVEVESIRMLMDHGKSCTIAESDVVLSTSVVDSVHKKTEVVESKIKLIYDSKTDTIQVEGSAELELPITLSISEDIDLGQSLTKAGVFIRNMCHKYKLHHTKQFTGITTLSKLDK